jgi:hypothetical protein
MDSVVQEHGDDFTIRLFAANKTWAQVDRELRKAGYSKNYPGSGWSSYGRVNRLVKEGRLKRVGRGRYVPCCPHCGEPFLLLGCN